MSRSIHGGRPARLAGAALLVLAALPLSGGCQMARSPWEVDTQGCTVETPSTTAIRSAEATAAIRARSEDPSAMKHVAVADGRVTHLPLWFEDPLEEIETDNMDVAYAGADFGRMLCSWSRFAGNLVLLPVSIVVNPPWQVMASDGVPSRTVLCCKHDASIACCH
jgi:hypothetical protein